MDMIVKVLTANRLIDGQAVWLGADGSWQETIDGALVARHAEAVNALEEAGRLAARANLVVDVNVIDVEERGADLYPIRLRERIRLSGPTIVTMGHAFPAPAS
ncbi:sulfite/nitrite reductase [Brucella abortus 82]|nr:sulfite/nitrite reductase [Brucella melitensis ADMAS-G1]ERM86872.1 sulfite/nitrite reductase [Brucella abortus 82]